MASEEICRCGHTLDGHCAGIYQEFRCTACACKGFVSPGWRGNFFNPGKLSKPVPAPPSSAETVMELCRCGHDKATHEVLIDNHGTQSGYCYACPQDCDQFTPSARGRKDDCSQSERQRPSKPHNEGSTPSERSNLAEAGVEVERQPPEFMELKEHPELRDLAQMTVDHSCFTNAILAVTEAYRKGWRAARASK